MSIDEIIKNYLESKEKKTIEEKKEKYYKSLISEYITTNNIMDLKKAIKEKSDFTTDGFSVVVDKTTQERFDQKQFLLDFPTAKKEYSQTVIVVNIVAVEKKQETEQIA